MRPTDNIKKLIGKLHLRASAELDKRVHDDITKALVETEKTKSAISQPNIWRTIMKSRITKLAAAAVIIIAAILGLTTILEQGATPAYAIGQTIEAFEKVDSVYVEQIIREKGTLLNTKMWARRGSDGEFFFGDFRQESGNGYTIVVNESENRTYYYNPSAKTVRIYERLNVTIGNFLDKNFYVHLQEEMEDVKIEYGKDGVTGKDIVLLKYKVPIPSKYDKSISKSGVITFDLESKLPIRMTSWDNPDFKGEPYSEWTLIEYNPKLPENAFKFEIPEDATVIRE